MAHTKPLQDLPTRYQQRQPRALNAHNTVRQTARYGFYTGHASHLSDIMDVKSSRGREPVGSSAKERLLASPVPH